MPWVETTAVKQRAELVEFALRDGARIAELCRRYEVSRKTAYKWLERYARGEPLVDRSHAPHASPLRTPPAVEQTIIDLRQRHPDWGARKLHRLLLDRGYPTLPTPSTITRVLSRAGLVSNDPAQKPATQRFEADAPNDLWQMDYKGPIQVGDGRLSILVVLDDHSRFLLALEACANQQAPTVQDALTGTFRRYGMPKRMLADNGSPWGSDGDHRYTVLTVWLLRLDIDVSHGRPYHPQTQGKAERFNRTLIAEFLKRAGFADQAGFVHGLGDYRTVYNHERPHAALDLATPASRYTPSLRTFPETLPPIEYGPDDQVRMVQHGGWISFHGREFRIGRSFRGYPVALRPTLEDGVFKVVFCNHVVETINMVERES